jgi:hypothetical protein
LDLQGTLPAIHSQASIRHMISHTPLAIFAPYQDHQPSRFCFPNTHERMHELDFDFSLIYFPVPIFGKGSELRTYCSTPSHVTALATTPIDTKFCYLHLTTLRCPQHIHQLYLSFSDDRCSAWCREHMLHPFTKIDLYLFKHSRTVGISFIYTLWRILGFNLPQPNLTFYCDVCCLSEVDSNDVC